MSIEADALHPNHLPPQLVFTMSSEETGDYLAKVQALQQASLNGENPTNAQQELPLPLEFSGYHFRPDLDLDGYPEQWGENTVTMEGRVKLSKESQQHVRDVYGDNEFVDRMSRLQERTARMSLEMQPASQLTRRQRAANILSKILLVDPLYEQPEPTTVVRLHTFTPER